MDLFEQELNNLLLNTYKQVGKIEEEAMHRMGQIDLSVSELHLLEAVGKCKEDGRTISDIAADLDITLPSVTIAINKLVKKNYVEKSKSIKDGRIVYVKLTKLGRKVDAGHQYFHKTMIRNIKKELSEEEKKVLLASVQKLNSYLGSEIDKLLKHNRSK